MLYILILGDDVAQAAWVKAFTHTLVVEVQIVIILSKLALSERVKLFIVA